MSFTVETSDNNLVTFTTTKDSSMLWSIGQAVFIVKKSFANLGFDLESELIDKLEGQDHSVIMACFKDEHPVIALANRVVSLQSDNQDEMVSPTTLHLSPSPAASIIKLFAVALSGGEANFSLQYFVSTLEKRGYKFQFGGYKWSLPQLMLVISYTHTVKENINYWDWSNQQLFCFAKFKFGGAFMVDPFCHNAKCRKIVRSFVGWSPKQINEFLFNDGECVGYGCCKDYEYLEFKKYASYGNRHKLIYFAKKNDCLRWDKRNDLESASPMETLHVLESAIEENIKSYLKDVDCYTWNDHITISQNYQINRLLPFVSFSTTKWNKKEIWIFLTNNNDQCILQCNSPYEDCPTIEAGGITKTYFMNWPQQTMSKYYFATRQCRHCQDKNRASVDSDSDITMDASAE